MGDNENNERPQGTFWCISQIMQSDTNPKRIPLLWRKAKVGKQDRGYDLNFLFCTEFIHCMSFQKLIILLLYALYLFLICL